MIDGTINRNIAKKLFMYIALANRWGSDPSNVDYLKQFYIYCLNNDFSDTIKRMDEAIMKVQGDGGGGS